ncbi:MAG: hypothetical protein JSU70_12250 [Phycisphaerales bacterium]|nr:MAG: hypothetical protein JSU70_12250 [Phycisphaerales bacterium]
MRGSRNQAILWTIPVLMVAFLASFPAYAKYGGGTGEPNDPYLIYTSQQMNHIGQHEEDWDKHFRLMADIDLSQCGGEPFNLIGTSDEPFSGHFDGNDCAIFGLHHTSADTDYIGLFACVDFGGEIRDLTLVDPNTNAGIGSNVGTLVGYLQDGAVSGCFVVGGSVSGGNNVGGLIGANSGTVVDCSSSAQILGEAHHLLGHCVGGLVGLNTHGGISNCHSSGSVSAVHFVGGLIGMTESGVVVDCSSSVEVAGFCIGGLIGAVDGAVISNCRASGDVAGGFEAGGLIGHNISGQINRCCATGTVEGDLAGGLIGRDDSGVIASCFAVGSASSSDWCGGLVGTTSGGVITDSYARGPASGNTNVGGLVGLLDGGQISRSYSCGKAQGSRDVGGLVGTSVHSYVSRCFWDTQTSGWTSSAGGIGMKTYRMQMRSTFEGAGWELVGRNPAGSDGAWVICEQTNYPRLTWQVPVGDLVCPDGVTMMDFSFFATHWLETECVADNDHCDGTDIDESGAVGIEDLQMFTDNWLEETEP